MDRLEALGSALSQVTMYDIKSMYNQVRPRPAPRAHAADKCAGEEHGHERRRDGGQGDGGDERRAMVCARGLRAPCGSALMRACRGASSTLMQDIAQG
jgi:hypothetical protein